MNKRTNNNTRSESANSKSLESWILDAACSIRSAKDLPKYKDYILPLIFTKRLCDVSDDELNRIAAEVSSRDRSFNPELGMTVYDPCGSGSLLVKCEIAMEDSTKGKNAPRSNSMIKNSRPRPGQWQT